VAWAAVPPAGYRCLDGAAAGTGHGATVSTTSNSRPDGQTGHAGRSRKVVLVSVTVLVLTSPKRQRHEVAAVCVAEKFRGHRVGDLLDPPSARIGDRLEGPGSNLER